MDCDTGATTFGPIGMIDVVFDEFDGGDSVGGDAVGGVCDELSVLDAGDVDNEYPRAPKVFRS